MKLHDVTRGPNPRRVRIFLAEKDMSDQVELVQVDLMAGAHKQPDFLRMNPSGKVPVLELDDGRALGESVAICRYLEALKPEPNLMGRDAWETSRIEMVNRQLEFELFAPIGKAWVNGPIVAQMAPGRFEQLPRVKEQGENETRRFYSRLDQQLESAPYMAGDRFTIADISALCMIDFATQLVDLKPDEEHRQLWDWHRRVSERPSANA
jgi:glutathione S-transferase